MVSVSAGGWGGVQGGEGGSQISTCITRNFPLLFLFLFCFVFFFFLLFYFHFLFSSYSMYDLLFSALFLLNLSFRGTGVHKDTSVRGLLRDTNRE